MFFQCVKCKKIWQYSIEECPECFLKLKRILAKKTKVIGISKVNIPSILHPKVPYFALVLEDENGNRWVQKSIKEYKIGETLDFKKNKDKNTVAVWRIKYDILEGIEKVIELLGGLKINQDTKILILPTLTSPKHPYFGENTKPKFLENLIKYLLKSGADSKNIKVASQSFSEIPFKTIAQKSQLLDVCQNFKISFLDLAKTNFIEPPATNNLMGGEISKEVFDSDLIINLPIFKIGKASALENILKVLKKDYSQLPCPKIEELTRNLNEVLSNCLTIADGEIVQKPDKFTTFLGLILAGFNPLNLDRVFAEISMNKDLPKLLKDIKIEDIPIAGRQIEEVQLMYY